MKHNTQSVGILGVGARIPEKVLSNGDLEKMVETSDEWITTRTGIKERRIAAESEATSDLATEAAREAIENAGLTPADIGLIIVCTITPDSVCPATACRVQTKLGISACPAFDLNAACSGFIYGLTTAEGLIKNGVAKYAVVIGAEVLSRFVDYEDRTTCILFGDGAGAAVLGPVDPPRGILGVDLGSDGAGAELIRFEGGSLLPPTIETVNEKRHCLRMNGSEVFKFAVKILGETVDTSLERSGLKQDDIDIVVPHQANSRIIEAARKRYGLENGRLIMNVDRYGNTSSASVPLALHEAYSQGRIKEGDHVVLVAFGGGLTWGSMVIRW